MNGETPEGIVINTGKPVIALDIDGTLADYHGWFLRFAELYLGKPMPNPKDINPRLPLHKFMGVSKRTYREVKLAYRQGGMKRSMPLVDGEFPEVVREIRKRAELWICTTRPYLRLDNIDPDTRHWLRRNHINYDAVTWGPNKYRDLAGHVGADRVIMAVDDQVSLTRQALDNGICNAVIMDQPYNRPVAGDGSEGEYTHRVYSARQILAVANAAINTYEKEN